MFGLGSILSVVNLGVRVAELIGGSGEEKRAKAMEEVTKHPLMTIQGNPELEREIEDVLLPSIVRVAHLVGSFSKESGVHTGPVDAGI
jgi:hypothetical protein